MLRPATVVDFSVLRALIRDNALTGSLERELASDSRESALFFTNLRQALATGYFVEEDPHTGNLETVALPGFVYLPDNRDAVHQPIGFGLFKAAAVGYELWLTGVESAWRGHGHGRAMLAALFTTQPGKEAYVVRVHTAGRQSGAMEHLLLTFSYGCARRTSSFAWYLRHDAPKDVGQQLRSAAPSLAAS